MHCWGISGVALSHRTAHHSKLDHRIVLQIGEFFEGIEPEESCYKVNAHLNFRYPEDWIAAI